MSNPDPISSLWCEKYRPATLQDIVLTKEDRALFESFAEKKEIPHLLFAGNPGVGKCLHGDELLEVYVSDELLSALQKQDLLD